jgi:hypothetical protein
MLYVEALSWRSHSQNLIMLPEIGLPAFRAIFHIKSDSATFNNIAVPSGYRFSDRVLAGCGIGPSARAGTRPSGARNMPSYCDQ